MRGAWPTAVARQNLSHYDDVLFGESGDVQFKLQKATGMYPLGRVFFSSIIE